MTCPFGPEHKWNEYGTCGLCGADRQKEEMRAALEAVEWFEIGPYPGQQPCPWCKEQKIHGHAPDCQRQKALGL